MKTPDEIKKGLECCADYGNCSEGCPYNPIRDCGNALYEDALAYIQQLEEERDAIEDDFARVGTEVKDPFVCDFCMHQFPGYGCEVCNFQWKGYLPEPPKEES